MKKIWFIRHAKSSWKNPELSDHDRPLNKRGNRDAPFMSAYLADNFPAPEKYVVSTATRAQLTARQFITAFDGNDSQIINSRDLYHAGESDILRLISELNEDLTYVALFGHNPTFTMIVNDLTGANLMNVPTCGCSLITSKADNWSNFADYDCDLSAYFYPKMFK